MKKTKSRILAIGLAAALSVGITAGCGNGNIGKDEDENNSKVTQISFRQWGGTASSTDWLQNSIDRFGKLKENEVYEDGKKGVKIEVSTNKNNDYTSSIPDYDILIDENSANLR